MPNQVPAHQMYGGKFPTPRGGVVYNPGIAIADW